MQKSRLGYDSIRSNKPDVKQRRVSNWMGHEGSIGLPAATIHDPFAWTLRWTARPVSPTTIAAFTYDPCVPCVPPSGLVLFNANSSLALTGTIVAYTWDFGDGTPPVKSSSPLVSHDYYLVSPNKWNVTLTVQDSNGLTNTVKQRGIFYVLPRFTFHPTRPMMGETTTFNASESISYHPYSGYNITGYKWNFGDGTDSHGEVVTHVYTASGAYRVILLFLLGGNGSGNRRGRQIFLC